MKITKLSHKALIETGRTLGGLYYDGNIYAHQNRVHYLQTVACSWRKDETVRDAKRLCPEISALVDEIAALDVDGVSSHQIAYSCGYYGNTGQLHKIDYYKGDTPVKTLFIYC